MNDLISVIIPVYNVEQYIDDCINSILKQTYHNLDIILIDDGSTDQSGTICDAYKAKDNRIEVIHKSNGGLSDARNYGIKNAKGKYITFVDSDDYVSSNYIEYLYTLLIDNNAEISISKLLKTNNRADVSRTKNPITVCMNNIQAINEILYSKNFSVAAPAKLYLKKLFDDIEFPLGKFAEDVFTIYKVIEKAKLIVYGNQICYYYYCHSNSLMTAKFSKKKLDVIEGLEQLNFDLSMKGYDIDKSYASAIVEAVISILLTSPNNKIVYELKIWNKVISARQIVIKDEKACRRVKAYALLSYFGLSFTMFVINIYYKRKWRNSRH